MDIKTLALTLGLPETADEAAVNAKLAELNASKEEADRVRQENQQLKLAQITAAVDTAIADGKIPADKKQHFLDLGGKVGIETLSETIAAMSPKAKLSSAIQTDVPDTDQPKKVSVGTAHGRDPRQAQKSNNSKTIQTWLSE